MFASQVRSITWGLFLVQLFLAVCLPGGSVLGVPLKLMSSGLFLAAFVFYLLTNGPFFSQVEITFMTVVTACLCFWSLIGVLNGQAGGQTGTTQVLSELKEIGSAILVAWLCDFAIRRNLVRAERLITVVIYGVFCVSAAKVVLMAASFLMGIDPIRIVQSVFGEESTSMYAIPFSLIRFDFPADIVGAFALFALLTPKITGVWFGRASTICIFIVVVLGSGLLTYSRFIWFTYVVSIFVVMILRRWWKAMAVTIFAALLIGVSFYDALNLVYKERFVTEAGPSDVERMEQVRDLTAEIKARPILGKGMGAHADTFGETHTYTYLTEWLGFLMQFGIVGLTGILLLVAASMRDLVMAKHPAKPWVLLLFALWLLESWTNPHITSSYAGATFGLFMAIFYRMRNASLNGEASVDVAMGLQGWKREPA